MSRVQWQECSTCNGRGRFGGDTCPACNGKRGATVWTEVPPYLMPSRPSGEMNLHHDSPILRETWWRVYSAEQYPDVYMHQVISEQERRQAESAEHMTFFKSGEK